MTCHEYWPVNNPSASGADQGLWADGYITKNGYHAAMPDHSDFSEKTLAAIAWCDAYALALSEFLKNGTHPARLRKQALNAWLMAKDEDPIHAAKRAWVAGKLKMPEPSLDASEQETLPGPLIR